MTTNLMDGKQVAETIIKQLVGHVGRLEVMTGAQYISYSSKELYLSFRFKMCKKANYCKIQLEPNDTYTITFGRLWGSKYKVVEVFDNVYAEDLKPIFERFTGLYLSL